MRSFLLQLRGLGSTVASSSLRTFLVYHCRQLPVLTLVLLGLLLKLFAAGSRRKVRSVFAFSAEGHFMSSVRTNSKKIECRNFKQHKRSVNPDVYTPAQKACAKKDGGQ